MPPAFGDDSYSYAIAQNFDELYLNMPRYWWRESKRHSTDPDDHPASLLTQMTLRLIRGKQDGRVLDLGAGEGADSIRLASLGYAVTAVEISKVAADKIRAFAAEEGVSVDVQVADISEYEPDGEFDIVVCNGVLHYIADKRSVIETMQRVTMPGGLNVISLWSTYTPVPECHNKVPVFCDNERGSVLMSYGRWTIELVYFERNKLDTSHDGMSEHAHSHIKLISRKPSNT
jgi:tellurite methyltransferase